MKASIWAALHDEGGRLKLVGDVVGAEAALRLAFQLNPHDPRTRHALGFVLLSQGRYEEGWPLYEARHDVPELNCPKPSLPYPEWRGEPLAGKRLLVFPEQGFGDQIMYARFAAKAAAEGATVTMLTPPPLARLFRSLPVEVIEAKGATDFPDPDYWVMSSDIAGRAGTTLETLPSAPYLSAEPTVSGGVGVAWRGNPAQGNDANRSLPADLGVRLLTMPGALGLAPEDSGASDFQDTAEIVAGLDIVITVDTSVAHLAGALGKPAIVLLPAIGVDWRWMHERADSPWYPSITLVRRAAHDSSWDPALERALALAGL